MATRYTEANCATFPVRIYVVLSGNTLFTRECHFSARFHFFLDYRLDQDPSVIKTLCHDNRQITAFQLDAYRRLANHTCFGDHHKMSLLVGGFRSLREQVWADLQWWPPDVSSTGVGPRSDVRGRGKSRSDVWGWGGVGVTFPIMQVMLPTYPLKK